MVSNSAAGDHGGVSTYDPIMRPQGNYCNEATPSRLVLDTTLDSLRCWGNGP